MAIWPKSGKHRAACCKGSEIMPASSRALLTAGIKCYPLFLMSTAPKPSDAPHQSRRSACGDRSNAVELERLRSMSVVERIRLALTLRKRFAWLQPKERTS